MCLKFPFSILFNFFNFWQDLTWLNWSYGKALAYTLKKVKQILMTKAMSTIKTAQPENNNVPLPFNQPLRP